MEPVAVEVDELIEFGTPRHQHRNPCGRRRSRPRAHRSRDPLRPTPLPHLRRRPSRCDRHRQRHLRRPPADDLGAKDRRPSRRTRPTSAPMTKTSSPNGTPAPAAARSSSTGTSNVDTHGESEIGFGITRLLGFDLLPRIKQINKVRLYRPATGQPDAYPQLTPTLPRPIRWDLVEQNYDQMIKYATAMEPAPPRRSCDASPAPRHTPPIRRCWKSAVRNARSSSPATCAAASYNVRSPKASMSSRRSTARTPSSTTARAARSPPTATTSRR